MKKLKDNQNGEQVEDNKEEKMALKQNVNGYEKLNVEEEKLKNEEKEKEEEKDKEKEEEEEDENSETNTESKGESGEVPEESKVGKLLADKTTKKVNILILSMMIGIILFNISFYLEKKTRMEMGFKIFTNFASMNDPDLNLTFSIYVSENLRTSSQMVYAKVG